MQVFFFNVFSNQIFAFVRLFHWLMGKIGGDSVVFPTIACKFGSFRLQWNWRWFPPPFCWDWQHPHRDRWKCTYWYVPHASFERNPAFFGDCEQWHSDIPPIPGTRTNLKQKVGYAKKPRLIFKFFLPMSVVLLVRSKNRMRHKSCSLYKWW